MLVAGRSALPDSHTFGVALSQAVGLILTSYQEVQVMLRRLMAVTHLESTIYLDTAFPLSREGEVSLHYIAGASSHLQARSHTTGDAGWSTAISTDPPGAYSTALPRRD